MRCRHGSCHHARSSNGARDVGAAQIKIHRLEVRKQTQRWTDRQTQTNRQTDRETERQRDRETETQRHRHTDTRTHRHTYSLTHSLTRSTVLLEAITKPWQDFRYLVQSDRFESLASNDSNVALSPPKAQLAIPPSTETKAGWRGRRRRVSDHEARCCAVTICNYCEM